MSKDRWQAGADLVWFRKTKDSGLGATNYRPELPTSQTNFGVAYWALETDGTRLRLFAPRRPPWRTLIAPLLASAAMAVLAAGAIVMVWRLKGSHQGGLALGIGGACLVIALTAVWVVVLGGNRREAARGDVLRCEGTSIELPRSGSAFRRADVVRVELARFVVWSRVTSHESKWVHRDLLVVRRGTDGQELFERIVRDGLAMKGVSSLLAERLGVPFLRTNVGTFDSRTQELVHS